MDSSADSQTGSVQDKKTIKATALNESGKWLNEHLCHMPKKVVFNSETMFFIYTSF